MRIAPTTRASENMRSPIEILVVTRNIPTLSSGGGKRNYHLLSGLAEKYHVTLLAISDDPAASARDSATLPSTIKAIHLVEASPKRMKRFWQIISTLVRRPSVTLIFSPSKARRKLRALTECNTFDAVVFQSVIVADHRLRSLQFVAIDEHNLEYELMERSAKSAVSIPRRIHYALEAKALKRTELRALNCANLVSVTSVRERAIMRSELSHQNIIVTPNGVDLNTFIPERVDAEKFGRIIFTGSMNYHPNEQAALYFADHIWPLIRSEVPDATWHIVGANPPPSFDRLADMDGVTVTGRVSETQSHLARAAVAVAPILVGGGTRLKILEALAMAKAVVTTSVGCEGLNVVDGDQLVVADTPDTFARAVIRLLDDKSRRMRLGSAGRALVEDSYGWHKIEQSFAAAIEHHVAATKTIGTFHSTD